MGIIRKFIFYSTRFKLIASFLGVSSLVGVVSLLIGGNLLYKAVLNEATNRVRLDLNAAREIYNSRIDNIKVSLSIMTLGFGFQTALQKRDAAQLVNYLKRLALNVELDFAGIVTRDGKTLCSIGPNSLLKEELHVNSNPVASLALDRRVPVWGTVVLNSDFLFEEDPKLADQAKIKLIQTPRAVPRAEKEETSGMALASAVPVFNGGDMLGILYGGVLLNRNQGIVDKVRDTVFQHEVYKGRSIGTATIFLKDLRISTNVINPGGQRAIGTLISKEVKDHVLDQGKRWTGRAFVVNDWYISAYEPIEDIHGSRVGMLYVGVLEEKYTDIQSSALSIFIILTVLSMLLAIYLGFILADKIMHPVHELIKASKQVSEGNLSPAIGSISNGEIGVLQKTFQDMIESLKKRESHKKAESEKWLLQSEKQASVGRLAAGVAHEINNPLTGVLVYTHMLLRRKDIGDDVRSDLEAIAKSTDRVRNIVKGLLTFSRQTELDQEPSDINRFVQSATSFMENQALIKGVNIKCNLGDNLPMLTLDRNQFKSALLNIIINALDATEPGDTITISTCVGLSASDATKKGIEVSIADTGCGIPFENLDKLFDPFYTTKDVDKGTGLGLSVSLGIVQRHGGTIRVQSEVGKGSTFTIWLPVEEKNEQYEDTGRG